MNTYRITSQRELRREFWATFPNLSCKRNRQGNPKPQNAQLCDTRLAWCDWIESLSRNGAISQNLAQRATL